MKLTGFLFTALIAIAAPAFAQSDGDEAGSADTVILGGLIYTGMEETPTAEAVAVLDGYILSVGAEEDVLYMADEATEIIDLRGAVMFPGFTDAHVHINGVGQRELTLNLEGSESLADMLDQVAAWAADTQPDGVIVGRGWIETHWPEGRMPTRADLDAVIDDRPVMLTRADGHALVANSAALDAAGIDADTPDPSGGRIERDEAGEATGILIDAAMAPVRALNEDPSREDIKTALRTGAKTLASYGWTGGHNMSVSQTEAELLDELASEGALPLRVYNSIDWSNEVLLDEGPWASPNRRNVTRAYKVYADGALGSRGAALLEPYADRPDTTGLVLFEEDIALDFFERALRAGIQVNTHAIGDAANRQVLDLYSQAFVAVPPDERAVRNPRWRIEHAQIVHPDDIERFAALGVIPSMQPSHAIGDLFFAVDRLGEDRMDGAYAWASLIESGAIIAAGSDAPVERGDPRIEFYAAVARMGLNGYQDENWRPVEAVTREQALKMFTLWPAEARFAEDELGTIEPGKRADFSVFSSDLMTIPAAAVLTVEPLMTMIDGAIAFEAEPELWPGHGEAAEDSADAEPEPAE